MNREQRAYERLFSGAKKPGTAPPLNPSKTMDISGGWLKIPAQIRFEQKHGVWFWMNHTKSAALDRLDQWGDTDHALYRLCRRLNLQWHWL